MLGNRFKQIRVSLNLSQTEMSTKMGISLVGICASLRIPGPTMHLRFLLKSYGRLAGYTMLIRC